MFEKLKRQLFWDQAYDQEWKYPGADALSRLLFKSKFIRPRDATHWERLIEGCKSNWRENGRRRRLPPRLARFLALQEVADLFYQEFHRSNSDTPDDHNLEIVLKEIAGILRSEAPFEGPKGEYVQRETHIAARWKRYVQVPVSVEK